MAVNFSFRYYGGFYDGSSSKVQSFDHCCFAAAFCLADVDIPIKAEYRKNTHKRRIRLL